MDWSQTPKVFWCLTAFEDFSPPDLTKAIGESAIGSDLIHISAWSVSSSVALQAPFQTALAAPCTHTPLYTKAVFPTPFLLSADYSKLVCVFINSEPTVQ